jgi:hypothetical protein
MKRTLLAVAAGAALLTSMAGAASAAPWQPIAERRADIEHRIDQGVRHGDLTRPEAMRLRGEFRDLQRLEARYRHDDGVLTRGERRDLQRRYDHLSDRVYAQRHDAQERTGRF